MTDKKILFVLGMHRSGTSALSGALNQAGVFFGESDDLLPPEPGINDKGFWEHRELVRINETLLKEMGQRWFSPFAGRTFLEKQSSISQSTIKAAQYFVSNLPHKHPCVGLKDPRLCLTVDFWYRYFIEDGWEIQAIHLLRNPAEVAHSLRERDNISLAHGYTLWLEHVSLAERFCSKVPSIRLFFDHLMNTPDRVLTFIHEALHIDINPDPIEVASWIEPRLTNHRWTNDIDTSEILAPPSQNKYAELQRQESTTPPGTEKLYNWTDTEVYLLNQLSNMFGDYNRQIIEYQKAHSKLVETKGALEEQIEKSQSLTDKLESQIKKSQSLMKEIDHCQLQLNIAKKCLGPLGRLKYRRVMDQH